MIRPTFEVEEVYFPVTNDQFEALVNEMLLEINKLSSPLAMDAEYIAQIVTSCLHAMERGAGTFKKTDLFDRSVHTISNHTTQQISVAISARKEAARKALTGESQLAAVPDELTEQ
jgi:hypothetical protein